MMQVDPTYSYETSDMNNLRLRYVKSNNSIEPTTQSAHFILSTGDFQLNGKDNDLDFMSRTKHNKKQIVFLIITALIYSLYTLRTLIPLKLKEFLQSWPILNPKSIPFIYTSDFRPSLFLENFALQLADICQTLWLIYILSYIARRNSIGYLYRYPNIFNSCLCTLLISVLFFRIMSQISLPSEISCLCLLIAVILSIVVCHLLSTKILKHAEKLDNIDLRFNRYFVLNSVVLYTTSITYITICASLECFSTYFDGHVAHIASVTGFGLSIVFVILLVYFILDTFIYKNELRSVWTPYLFVAIVFVCPPYYRLESSDTFFYTDNYNFYSLWTIFISSIFMMLFRLIRQTFIEQDQLRKQPRIKPSKTKQEALKEET